MRKPPPLWRLAENSYSGSENTRGMVQTSGPGFGTAACKDPVLPAIPRPRTEVRSLSPLLVISPLGFQYVRLGSGYAHPGLSRADRSNGALIAVQAAVMASLQI